MGEKKHIKEWTEEEISFLKNNYPDKGKHWCMGMLNRREGQVRLKASRLGLKLNQDSEFWKGFQKRAAEGKIGNKHSKKTKEKMSDSALKRDWKISKGGKEKRIKAWKKRLKEKGHPKGMLGKHHSEKTKTEMSEARRGRKLSLSEKQRQEISDRTSAMMVKRIKNKGSIYSRANVGWYKIAGVRGKHYFRSGWEVVYARYLQWLKNTGRIEKWEYEPDTFWFKEIKRGVRSYTPDFKIYNWTGTTEFHEVKGYMNDKSKTKIKRMAKYYPKIALVVICKKEYKPIERLKRMFPEAVKCDSQNK